MPFKPDNSGQTQLIGMLLQHQRDLIAQKQKAASDAMANAREERKARLEALEKGTSILTALAGEAEAASARIPDEQRNIILGQLFGTGPEVQAQAAFEATQPSQQPGDFASIVQGLDSRFKTDAARRGAVSDVTRVASDRALGSVRNRVNMVADASGISRGDAAAVVDNTLGAQGIERQRELDKAVAADKRITDRAITIKEMEIAASEKRPTNVILQRDATIKHLEILLRDEGDKMTPDQRALTIESLDSLYAERQAERVRNVPDEWFKQRTQVADRVSQYNTTLANRTVLNQLLESSFTDEGAIGIEAVLTRFALNAEDVIQTTTGMGFEEFYVRSVELGLQNSTASDESKAAAREKLLSDEILDNIARGELGQVELAWTLNHMFNPSGRVNQKQLDAISDATRFIGLTVGPRLGRSRMRVAIERADQALQNMRFEINRIDPSLRFDPKTGAPIANTPHNGKLIQEDLAPRSGREARGEAPKRQGRDLLNSDEPVSVERMMEIRRMEGLNAGE